MNLFPDESHWLICYSTESADAGLDAEEETDAFDNWQWEGMQGNDTDRIITTKVADHFTENMHKYLLARSRYTVGEAVNQGFLDIMPGIMERSFSFESDDIVYVLLYSGLMIVLPAFFIVKKLKRVEPMRGKENAVKCPTDQGKLPEDTCEYCGGLFVHGIHISCPHCGAPVKPMQPESER